MSENVFAGIPSVTALHRVRNTTGTNHCPVVLQVQVGDELANCYVKPVQSHYTIEAMATEVIANLIARTCGIRIPDPVVVLLQESLQSEISAGSEIAFGSMEIPGLLSELGQFRSDPIMCQRVFAFDLLTGNIDRRANNPNLGMTRKEMYAYDFEFAFSFLVSKLIGKTDRDHFSYDSMCEISKVHCLYGVAKNLEPERSVFENFEQKITDDYFESLAQTVPQAFWNVLKKISEYSCILREEMEDVQKNYNRVLKTNIG